MRRILSIIAVLLACCMATGCMAGLIGSSLMSAYEDDYGYKDDYYYGDDYGYGYEGDYGFGLFSGFGTNQELEGYTPGAHYEYAEPVYDPNDDTWTVLLYLCGTDLESEYGAATDNLLEALGVTDTPSVNLLVQTGGTMQWQNNAISPDSLQRFKLSNGGVELVDEQRLSSMGAPQTLADFVAWGRQNYPADKYALVIWNHGGGSTSGVAFDEVFNFDSLTLVELGAALSVGGVHFEFIGFDACLMATLENAATIAPYANYMVASEELEPGGGWDYYAWLQFLNSNPNSSGLEVGEHICQTYFAKCERTGDGPMATLSVVDLSKIPALVSAFDAMAVEMTGITEDVYRLREYTQQARRTESYGGNTWAEGYTNMVDLGDLAINTQSVVSQTAEGVLDALFDAVVYNVSGPSRSGANGLSVFFPLGVDSEVCNSYAEVAVSGSYLRFIEALYPEWSAPELSLPNQQPALQVDSVQQGDYEIYAESYVSDDGLYCVDVLSGMEIVHSVTFNLYYMDYEYSEYMLLGTDNDIDGDWAAGHFKDNLRGVWPTLNGYYCAPVIIAEEEEYNLYSIPVLLNGEEYHIRAAYLWYEECFVIYGAWEGLDAETGMSSRDLVKLEDGDVVELLFDGTNWDTGETTTYIMGEFTVRGEVVMEETELLDGEYAYEFVVTDVFGNEYFSDPVIMEVYGEDIYIYEVE